MMFLAALLKAHRQCLLFVLCVHYMCSSVGILDVIYIFWYKCVYIGITALLASGKRYGNQTTRLNSFFPWAITIYCFVLFRFVFLHYFRCSFKCCCTVCTMVVKTFCFCFYATLQYHQKLWRGQCGAHHSSRARRTQQRKRVRTTLWGKIMLLSAQADEYDQRAGQRSDGSEGNVEVRLTPAPSSGCIVQLLSSGVLTYLRIYFPSQREQK